MQTHGGIFLCNRLGTEAKQDLTILKLYYLGVLIRLYISLRLLK
jgi:hypothetical protein